MEYYLKTRDFLNSGEEFQLKLDADKDLLITTPRPENLENYYKSEDYISHTDSKEGFVAKLYQWVKRYSIRKKLRIIEKYADQERSLLDIGAGTGDLLLAARKLGYIVQGIEPNDSARKLAAAKGITLKADLSTSHKFKVITLWHVLEHLPDPVDEIAKLRELLADNGALFIAIPNFRSFDADYYKSYWAGYDVPRHLWHFSRTAIKDLVETCDMEIVETRPMIFDAFYISMLSEKYKTGKNNFLKALYTGFLSNTKAKRTGEYSSLLYIIKKSA